jgi:muconolactone delta-isomerase
MQVLAVMTAPPGRRSEEFAPYQQEEETRVWSMYREGRLRQIWFRSDDKLGAVALLEVESLEEARTLVEDLPMMRAGMLVPEFVSLAPFLGLEQLFAPENRTPGGH